MKPGSAVQAAREGAVLFLDDDGWASFDQVAVALKRRGVRVIRVITSGRAKLLRCLKEPHLRWSADHLFYDEVLVLSTPEGRKRLEDLAASGAIADVITTEPSLLQIGLDSELGRLLAQHSLAFRHTPPSVLMDKYKVNVALEAAGVPTPRQLPVSACSPTEAARRMGLPLLVKAPIGASGFGVRLAHTLAELEAAVKDLSGGPLEPFYQQHVPGPVVMYGAVIGPGGVPLIEHGFKVERTQSDLGPSAAVSLYDRPRLMEMGRRAAAVFKPEGFAAFGFVESPDGEVLHIDANIRIWGMIAAPLKLGIDFVEAYACLVRGMARQPAAERPTMSEALPVYPYALFEPVRSGAAREIVSSALEFVRTCRGALGWRYCLQSFGQALLLGQRRIRRGSGRPRPATLPIEDLAADGPSARR